MSKNEKTISSETISAGNYLTQKLAHATFEGINAVPPSVDKPEILLLSIKTFLANLLSQKFEKPQDVLDDIYHHVSMALKEIEARAKNQKPTINPEPLH